jgi:hypothetical protein
MVGFFYSAHPKSGARLAKALGVKVDDAKVAVAPVTASR